MKRRFLLVITSSHEKKMKEN